MTSKKTRKKMLNEFAKKAELCPIGEMYLQS